MLIGIYHIKHLTKSEFSDGLRFSSENISIFSYKHKQKYK